MGCDIHWWSETKKDGAWVCDQAASLITEDEGTDEEYTSMDNFPNSSRDYWFFGLLNRVRGEYSWSFPEQWDVPDDISEEVRNMLDSWGSDGHSLGSLTRADLKAKLQEMYHLRVGHLINPQGDTRVLHHHSMRLEQTISDLSADVPDEDQRIVFCFDN